MYQSLVNGRVTTLSTAGLFSDGTSVRQVGQETWRVCSSFVDDMVHVTTDEICAAIKDVYAETRTVLEVGLQNNFVAERCACSGRVQKVPGCESWA